MNTVFLQWLQMCQGSIGLEMQPVWLIQPTGAALYALVLFLIGMDSFALWLQITSFCFFFLFQMMGVACYGWSGIWKESMMPSVKPMSYPKVGMSHNVQWCLDKLDRIKFVGFVSLLTGKGLSLIGHSAGGWLARVYMEEYGTADISLLLTLGTPHL